MSLYSVRADLAELLAKSGYTVHDHVPDVINPPCIAIEPADRYVQWSLVFGSQVDVRHDVWLLMDVPDNEAAANALDTALVQVLALLDASDYDVVTCGQPGLYVREGWVAHGVPITVETTTTIEGAPA